MGTLLPKLILAISVLTVLFFAAFWLWQRQPKGQVVVEPITTQIATQEAKSEQIKLIESPKDNAVITSTKVTISGKLKPNTYINFFTASYQYVAKVDTQGKYQKDVTLSKGLNLIKVATFTQDLQEDKAENLTLFAAADESSSKTVFAGIVKAIFDTTITLSTPLGDKNVRTTQSTNINAPTSAKDDKQAPKNVQNSVRVGDFAVAIGNPPTDANITDSLDAQSLEIIRENKQSFSSNKPQNVENIIAAKVAGNVNQNLFSVKNIKDAKSADFILNKNSNISVGDKMGTAKDIVKDKTAFIFYHTEDDKNLVDLLYLLP